MEIKELIRDIKSQYRTAMNGVASAHMRESGLAYKINFGIELPRLLAIARDYEPNHELAQTLWKEGIRESKILAGVLMPVDNFFPEIADIWVEQIPTQEIAELTVMNLFVRLPYASSAAFRWISDPREIYQVCGLLLLTRLCMKGCSFNESASFELVDQAVVLLQDSNQRVAQQAFILLRKFLQMDVESCHMVRQAVESVHPVEGTRLEGWCQVLLAECME